ncbi:formylglycine-generating enzyme family protein [uncultured Pseudokineococcus sp.]|uniref:formylglycine-generating enzyme family protein n=1 Tax=uncultured Pseudokineococcus sp. TaxID=1642928 RepID=UPI0026133D65|nr:formylglycine-generating enzyme family protein [uncultured Pseudokineococcus sp.]
MAGPDHDAPRSACCAPSAADVVQPTQAPPRPPVGGGALSAVAPGRGAGEHRVEQAAVPAQVFAMGDARGDGRRGDGETPVHAVELDAFSIDVTSVTVADFARFVDATGHVTEAEVFGFSAVFHLALAARDEDVLGRPAQTPWWFGVRGADWRHPGGPLSDVDGLEEHPVTHVSWNDAVAYCAWAGRSLPSEAQWECASRGGVDGARYPWGEELPAAWACNIWQGDFPVRNTEEDGFLTTSPVRSYAPNAYGLWQTVGNVWEWCADWSDPGYYARSPRRDPRGPERETGQRVMRGGSYLCHDSYCNRYRNSARSANTPDSSMGNAGFRTVGRA